MMEYYQYKQIMEQVDYPDGVKSVHTVVCTKQQAAEIIGQLYKDNPSWRIVKMEMIKPFPMPSVSGQ